MKNKLLSIIPESLVTRVVHWLINRYGAEEFSRILGLHPDVLKVRPGHFYSPIPDIPMVESRWRDIFDVPAGAALGVDENIAQQLELAEKLGPLFKDFPYSPVGNENVVSGTFDGRPLRFSSNDGNTTFHLDAVILQAMLRHFKPSRVVEVGSGYSSAVILDVRERERWENQELTFIEPYSQAYFFPLLRAEDRNSIRIIEQPLWAVDRAIFESLQSGDLLFIDSSHVAKIGSDVYDYMFNIIPRLKAGVIVHIHDITPNFEAAGGWFKNGWYWNEGAFLRAFLMYNQQFEILFHSSLLLQEHREAKGIRELKNHAKNTFSNDRWRWANSFYLRRKP